MELNNANGSMSIVDRVRSHRALEDARRHHFEAHQQELERFADEFQQMKILIANLQADLDDERHTRREYRIKALDLEEAIKRKKFVVVLIDGDGYKFKHQNIDVDAEHAGAHAASAIHDAVLNYLKGSNLPSDYDILVNVFVNKAGLGKALLQCGVVSSSEQFDQFFYSFSHQPLFQFFDCGQGKERADAKLRDLYRFYAHDVHCQHIFLACCHDNGYVAELDKYRHDIVAKPKTLLIKHPNTGAQYSKSPFQMVDFGSLFESMPNKPAYRSPTFKSSFVAQPNVSDQPIPQPAMPAVPNFAVPVMRSNSNFPNKSKNENGVADRIGTGPSAVSGSYAVVTSSSDQAGDVVIKPSVMKPKGIPINRDRQRVDVPLPPPTQKDLDAFSDRKKRIGHNLCNQHHLSVGGCTSYACGFDHEPIDENLKRTLRYKVRGLACPQGAECRYEYCYRGHQCPWGNKCTNRSCAYADELHDVDTKIYGYVAPE